MSIANPGQPAPGLPYVGTAALSPTTGAMKRMYHQAVIKPVISAAIAVGASVAGAAPATADKTPPSTDPKAFEILSCDCRAAAPPGSPVRRGEEERGVQEGLLALPSELPRPAQPRNPRS